MTDNAIYPVECRCVNDEKTIKIKKRTINHKITSILIWKDARKKQRPSVRTHIVSSAHLSKSKSTRFCPCLLLLHHSYGGKRDRVSNEWSVRWILLTSYDKTRIESLKQHTIYDLTITDKKNVIGQSETLREVGISIYR